MPTLQELATQLNEIYKNGDVGTTPLQDIEGSSGSPAVQMLLPALEGLRQLHGKFDSFTGGLSSRNNCGEDLDRLGAMMGIARKIEFKSVVPMVFTTCGCGTCFSINSGTRLIDKSGNQWETLNSINLSDGMAFVNAASIENGSFDLAPGDLELADPIDGVIGTNSASPDLGGSVQDDESYRRRLLNLRPNWRIRETEDAVLNSLRGLPGVLRADVVRHPIDCCPMVVVMGGDDSEIANEIYLNAPFSVNNLCGSSKVTLNDCTDVSFQRYCPAIVNLRLWPSCECSEQTEQEALEIILSKAADYAVQYQTLDASSILCNQSYFNRVEFRVESPKLAACVDDNDLVKNPVTGEDFYFAVLPDDYGLDGSACVNSICDGGACDEDYSNVAELCDYQFPIIRAESIEVMPDDCVDCDNC